MAMLGKVTSLYDAEKASDQFELLLRNLGVELTNGGALERLHLVMKRLVDLHAGRGTQRPGEDLRKDFRDLVGITQIIDLALKLPAASLPKFKKHFELLNVGTPLQNTPAPRNDPSGDKVLELLVGLAAVRMGATVELDDPENAQGDNPDVLARFANEVWGFACKVPSGDAPATLFERIADGVKQIERSVATHGLVVLNFKNRFDHDSEIPVLGKDSDGDLRLGVHRDHQQIVIDLKEFNETRIRAMADYATPPEVEKLFAGKKALPALIVISQTTAGVRLPPLVAPPGAEGAPVPARVGFVHLLSLSSSADDDQRIEAAKPMLSALNDALADV
ncbi:hypothetical protein [Sorangium sp. So ce1335]|uniref:hypothetical protein n=1 Tax=Sorangium sp. So ce1335 TaxID=3133335 RepID=UPI003F609E98